MDELTVVLRLGISVAWTCAGCGKTTRAALVVRSGDGEDGPGGGPTDPLAWCADCWLERNPTWVATGAVDPSEQPVGRFPNGQAAYYCPACSRLGTHPDGCFDCRFGDGRSRPRLDRDGLRRPAPDPSGRPLWVAFTVARGSTERVPVRARPAPVDTDRQG